MKNKLELIKEMNRLKVTNITLPPRDVKGCRRPQSIDIDLSKTYEAVLPNYPDDKKGHTSNEAERETHKYTYADKATSDGKIPGMEELKEILIKEITEKHKELLECDMQKELRSHGYTWIWTPAYCPWLQPIEVRSTGGPCRPSSPQTSPATQTFWAVGKGYAAAQNRNKRTMRQCIAHLRAGWYGNAQYHLWVAGGSRKQEHGKPIGPAERATAAQKRFGRKGQPKKTEADWIPAACHRGVNCEGLMRAMMEEADKMVAALPGLSGSISGVTADHNSLVCDLDVWTPVDSHTRDMSDLTGVNTAQLVPNDTVLRMDNGGVSIVPDNDDGDLPRGTTAAADVFECTRCGCECGSDYLCEPCHAYLLDEAGMDSDGEDMEDGEDGQ
eukprot:COSAG05_NODE_23_length_31591_cov_92.542995_27_plen_385_part_00